MQYSLGENVYAMPFGTVLSVEKVQDVTPIPKQESRILGAVLIRDTLFTVMDTKYLLNETFSYSKDDVFLLLENKIAFRVTRIIGLKEIVDSEIQETLGHRSVAGFRAWIDEDKVFPIVDLSLLVS
jgi:chemotaxis signal transduction protein